MPAYTAKALLRFQHIAPAQPQHSPHVWQALVYGATTQLTAPIDDSTLLNVACVTCTPVLWTILSSWPWALSRRHPKVTALVQLLNYCATHSDAVI